MRRADVGQLRERLVLPPLRRLERVARLEHGTRVRHRLVEEEREELVRQVVVARDVLGGAGERVLLVRGQPAVEQPPDPAKRRGCEPVERGGERRERPGEVVSRPVSRHVGLAEADAAVRAEPVEEVLAMDRERRRSRPALDGRAAVGKLDGQCAYGQRAGGAQEERAGDPGARRRGDRLGEERPEGLDLAWRSSDSLLRCTAAVADVGDAAPVKAQALEVDEGRHLRGHERIPDQHPPQRAGWSTAAAPLSETRRTRARPPARGSSGSRAGHRVARTPSGSGRRP